MPPKQFSSREDIEQDELDSGLPLLGICQSLTLSRAIICILRLVPSEDIPDDPTCHASTYF
jgi:hypothetical protein